MLTNSENWLQNTHFLESSFEEDLLLEFIPLACKALETVEYASYMGGTKRLVQDDSFKSEAHHTEHESISTFSHLLKKAFSEAPHSSHTHAGQVKAARDPDCSIVLIGSSRWVD